MSSAMLKGNKSSCFVMTTYILSKDEGHRALKPVNTEHGQPGSVLFLSKIML
jgi:hypothetical protein